MSHQIQQIKEPEMFRQNLQYKIGELFADMDLDTEKKTIDFDECGKGNL